MAFLGAAGFLQSVTRHSASAGEGRMQWNREILEKYVAPEIADFTSADVPDLRPDFPEWTHWMANQFLNNVFRGRLREPWRQYAINFIHRAQATFRFFHSARDITFAYLAGNDPLNPKVGQYYEALSAWEATLLNWAICVDLTRRMKGRDVFQKNDGSPEQRAYSLHNTIKHHASNIHSGPLDPSDTLTFWLTTTGLNSKTDKLSYPELAALVRKVGALSNDLQDVRALVDAGRNPLA
jgi:hypothetical protein